MMPSVRWLDDAVPHRQAGRRLELDGMTNGNMRRPRCRSRPRCASDEATKARQRRGAPASKPAAASAPSTAERGQQPQSAASARSWPSRRRPRRTTVLASGSGSAGRIDRRGDAVAVDALQPEPGRPQSQHHDQRARRRRRLTARGLDHALGAVRQVAATVQRDHGAAHHAGQQGERIEQLPEACRCRCEHQVRRRTGTARPAAGCRRRRRRSAAARRRR